ncbi:MAG TPA: hypothetical protein VN032_08660 [Thermoanaerobaculia bacterium]|jgi:hypothetical protein|nr:hypothetical protein [Thermoanaerobaculia bacterium]
MNKKLYRSLPLAAALALVATAVGAQTFQNFVTVGDSLIAGEESGCVVQRFQRRSWVAITAGQLGLSDFEQPWISEVAATNPLTGYPCLGLVLNGTSLGLAIVSETGQNTNLTLPRPYNNLGFNGSPLMADFVELTVTTPGASDLDNLAGRVLRNCMGCPFQGMSAVDEANLLTPDLVAFWGGNNDVLNAMFAGVAIVGVTITPVDSFTNSTNQVIAGLSASGRTLVSGNIPNIIDIPYATTIPPVVVDPTTMLPVLIGGQLVPLLGPGDDAFPCTPVPPDSGCALPQGSLVMLPASTLLGQGVGIPVAVGGTGQPLPHGTFTPPSTLVAGVVLYPDDITLIESTIVSYNQAIAAALVANGGIPIDSNALFAQVSLNGFDIGGIHLSTAYATGGIFSYDGVHPAPSGYGIVADDFIQLLNTVKGTNIPRPNFSNILFTPNVPEITSAVTVADNGPWHYSLDTWRGLLNAGLARRFAIQMPTVPDAPRVVPHLPPAPRAVRHVERHDFD